MDAKRAKVAKGAKNTAGTKRVIGKATKLTASDKKGRVTRAKVAKPADRRELVNKATSRVKTKVAVDSIRALGR